MKYRVLIGDVQDTKKDHEASDIISCVVQIATMQEYNAYVLIDDDGKAPLICYNGEIYTPSGYVVIEDHIELLLEQLNIKV